MHLEIPSYNWNRGSDIQDEPENKQMLAKMKERASSSRKLAALQIFIQAYFLELVHLHLERHDLLRGLAPTENQRELDNVERGLERVLWQLGVLRMVDRHFSREVLCLSSPLLFARRDAPCLVALVTQWRRRHPANKSSKMTKLSRVQIAVEFRLELIKKSRSELLDFLKSILMLNLALLMACVGMFSIAYIYLQIIIPRYNAAVAAGLVDMRAYHHELRVSWDEEMDGLCSARHGSYDAVIGAVCGPLVKYRRNNKITASTLYSVCGLFSLPFEHANGTSLGSSAVRCRDLCLTMCWHLDSGHMFTHHDEYSTSGILGEILFSLVLVPLIGIGGSLLWWFALNLEWGFHMYQPAMVPLLEEKLRYLSPMLLSHYEVVPRPQVQTNQEIMSRATPLGLQPSQLYYLNRLYRDKTVAL